MANPIIPHSPTTYRRVVAHTISYDFANSIGIEVVHRPTELKPSDVFVKILYAGVNASDINYVAGKYTPGAKPPLYPGFEAVGEVVLKGSKVTNLEIGDAVFLIGGNGCFAEYNIVNQKTLIKIAKSSVEYIVLFASGLTASLALEEVGQMKTKETVLVTAAAGGTGHIAVQLAKLAGNHVIGTCSSDSKVAKLKAIGCDRVINYNKESLDQVLKTEYPTGVDVVYESVGGETFDICVNHLAIKGRLIVIGAISAYKDPNFWRGTTKTDGKNTPPLSLALLRKSASVRGFFLNNFMELWMVHFAKLCKLMEEGKLKPWVDDTKFVGLESVAKAVEHMYNGKNSGKVVIDIHGSKSNL